jgi:hypothetical protein
MLFASSNPHDDFSIKFLGERIEVISMDLFFRRGVLTEAAVDGHIGERCGRVLRAVVHVGSRLAQVGARLAIM